MKTALMALDVAVAGVLAWGICRTPDAHFSPAALARNVGLFLAGLAIVPGLLLVWFAAHSALPNLYYCLIQHNLVAAAERKSILNLRNLATLLAFGSIFLFALRVRRSTAEPALAIRRVFILLAGAVYPFLLFVLWPLNTREDLLAMMPVIAMTVSPLLFAALDAFRQRFSRMGWGAAVVPTYLFLAYLALDALEIRPWENRTIFQQKFLANTLKLTNPGEKVMDTKGEMIYRERAYYYVLEEMTRWKFQRAELADDLPQRMIDNGICVAAYNSIRYPQETAKFLHKNFLPVAFCLLVPGKILTPPAEGRETVFQIAIPTEYALASARGTAGILLDGKPYQGPVRLAPGNHTLQTAPHADRVAVVWARTVQRGFSPFYRPTPDEMREASLAHFDNIL